MLDHLGAVAECTAANVFAVVGGALVTPTTRSALPGDHARTILEVAAEQGIPTEVRDVWPMELYMADAMFATGSGAGIVPTSRASVTAARILFLSRLLPGASPLLLAPALFSSSS